MTNSELILKALGVCHTLTYNEEPEGSAKHLLRELAHRLDRAREINCDQVAWMLNAIDRYLPRQDHPAVSRFREVQKYGLLYELMEVAGLVFEDDAAAHNGTPRDVRMLRRKEARTAANTPAASGKILGEALTCAQSNTQDPSNGGQP